MKCRILFLDRFIKKKKKKPKYIYFGEKKKKTLLFLRHAVQITDVEKVKKPVSP